MRGIEIEAKLDRLEMAVEALRAEVDGIKSDIRKRHEADGQAEAAGETGTPKKRTRKKAEPAE